MFIHRNQDNTVHEVWGGGGSISPEVNNTSPMLGHIMERMWAPMFGCFKLAGAYRNEQELNFRMCMKPTLSSSMKLSRLRRKLLSKDGYLMRRRSHPLTKTVGADSGVRTDHEGGIQL